MLDAALLNIGMVPRKERVLQGQSPLLMNYSDEVKTKIYIHVNNEK
jgi:hypothetical protein